MNKIFIPRSGTLLQLISDWSFTINRSYMSYNEHNLIYRYHNLSLDDYRKYNDLPNELKITLPDLSIIKIIKLEVNPHKKTEFVTCSLTDSPDRRLVTQPKATPRFTVYNLDEFNSMEYKIFEEKL